MTILVAVKKNNRVFLGSDSLTASGNTVLPDLKDRWKIIKLEHGYMASSGYSLLENIIGHLIATNHKIMKNTFSSRNDVFSFCLELYAELKKNYNLVDPGKETFGQMYNHFVLATVSSIYAISSNLDVMEHERYVAKGAGTDYALGCLYGVYDMIDDGPQLVRTALEAACKFNVYCRGPLHIIEVKESTSKRKGKESVEKDPIDKSRAKKVKAQAKTTISGRKKTTRKS
jgi:ATP-dependent protease HslVU (ClpYQ) peptidase subunit